MYTPESLLEVACAAEARYKKLREQSPPGTYNEERNAARREMGMALNCAAWMQEQGHAELSHVGPFGEIAFRRGGRVRVKAGAVIYSTRPGHSRDGEVAQRARVVRLVTADAGSVIDEVDMPTRSRDGREPLVRQPRITWAGSGSYWHWTEITNVEAAD